jgi:hypothetical protein
MTKAYKSYRKAVKTNADKLYAKHMEAIPKTLYFVLNNNTLGYVYETDLSTFWPLAANVDGYDWKNGAVAVGKHDILKPATISDFDKFRVRHEGHI